MRHFATRAEAITWIGRNTAPDGYLISIGDLQFRALAGATAISDMAGWVPEGTVTPNHMKDNTTPGTTDMSSAISAAMVYLNSIGGGTLKFIGENRMTACVEGLSDVNLDFTGASIVVTGALDTSDANSVTVDGETVSWNAAHDLFYWRDAQNVHITGGFIDMGGLTGRTAAARVFDFIACRDYSVAGVTCECPGAFIASRFGKRYQVVNNEITIVSSDGLAAHDGVIDQWWGSSDFLISENTIRGENIAKYPILVTSTDTNNLAAKCQDFVIVGNKVFDCSQAGIWAMGRNGICEKFTIANNLIDGVTAFHGLIVSDSVGFTVTGNVIRNCEVVGIRLMSENAGTWGDNGARNGVVSGNTIEDVNLGLFGSSAASAIYVLGDCKNLALIGNVVTGTTHTYPIYINGAEDGEDNIHVFGGHYSEGTVGGVTFASSPANSTGVYPDDAGGVSVMAPGGVTITAPVVSVSGIVQGGSGAVSAPTYSFTTDTDSGFYLTSAGIISGAVSGAERFRMTASGTQVRASTTESVSSSIGTGRSGDGVSSLNLIADATYTSAGLQAVRYAGKNGIGEIRHRGTGAFQIVTQESGPILLTVGANERFRANSTGIGFFGANPVAKPTVTGSRGGNAAVASFLTAMANLGLITDSSSP